MCDKAILEKGELLKPVLDSYKNQEMCNKALNNYPYVPEYWVIKLSMLILLQ